MTSWILMRIEDGGICHWDGGGDWFTPDRWQHIVDSEQMEIPFSDERILMRYLETGPDVWQVLFVGVSWETEEPGWDLNYGYDFGSAWIEYESFEIKPHNWEPKEHGFEPGEFPAQIVLDLIRKERNDSKS